MKVAAVTGQNPDRDVALLFVFYGTGLTSNEVAKLLVLDYLMADGRVQAETTLRAEIAFNGKVRPLVWSSQKTCDAIDDYLEYRFSTRQGITTSAAAFRALDPTSPLFLTSEGEPFRFTRRVTPSGAVSYSCESLTEIVRQLHQHAGIERGTPRVRSQTAP